MKISKSTANFTKYVKDLKNNDVSIRGVNHNYGNTLSHKKICTLSVLALKDKESRVCDWSLSVCRRHWANIRQRNCIPVNLFPLQHCVLSC